MPKNRPQKGKVLMMWQLFYQRKEKSRGSINSSFTLTNNSDDICVHKHPLRNLFSFETNIWVLTAINKPFINLDEKHITTTSIEIFPSAHSCINVLNNYEYLLE